MDGDFFLKSDTAHTKLLTALYRHYPEGDFDSIDISANCHVQPEVKAALRFLDVRYRAGGYLSFKSQRLLAHWLLTTARFGDPEKDGGYALIAEPGGRYTVRR